MAGEDKGSGAGTRMFSGAVSAWTECLGGLGALQPSQRGAPKAGTGLRRCYAAGAGATSGPGAVLEAGDGWVSLGRDVQGDVDGREGVR